MVPRGGGESLTGVYNRAGHEMTVDFAGATYTGNVIQGQSTGIGFAGARTVTMMGISNQFSSVMVGPGGAIRCDFSLGGTGGNGLCLAPDGKTYDLILK